MKSRNECIGYLLTFGLLLLAGSSTAQGQPPDESSYIAPRYTDDTVDSEQTGPGDIKPGAKIRIYRPTDVRTGLEKGGYLEGRFHSLEDGILTMTVDEVNVSTPVDRIFQLQVYEGGSGGALVGAFGGLAIGGLIAAAAQPDRSDEGLAGLSHMGGDMAQGTFIVILGVAIGAGIGASLDSGSWQNVSLQHQAFGQMGRTGSDYRLAYGFGF